MCKFSYKKLQQLKKRILKNKRSTAVDLVNMSVPLTYFCQRFEPVIQACPESHFFRKSQFKSPKSQIMTLSFFKGLLGTHLDIKSSQSHDSDLT